MAIIKGTNKNNVLNGTAFNDFIFGLKGNDTLFGFGGRDLLFGNDGNDKLFGGSGSDILYGGKDKNILTGGTGQDTYVLTKGKSNADTINIAEGESFTSAADVIFTGKVTGFDTIIGFDKYDKLNLDVNPSRVMANANVNTVNDTPHFTNFSVNNGILNLKNGANNIALTSEELLQEAFIYVISNLDVIPNDVAVAVNVDIGIHETNSPIRGKHALVFVDHTDPGFTIVDVVGSLNSLNVSQII